MAMAAGIWRWVRLSCALLAAHVGIIVGQHCQPNFGAIRQLESEILIGALTDLSSSTNKACGSVNERSVQDLEAFRWTLRRIQESGYLKNITVDVLADDTCGDPQQATKVLRRLLMGTQQSYIDVTCTRPQVLLGIFGPSVSGAAANVGSVLNTNSQDHRLLQISHSATATFLTQGEKYLNFYSLVPGNDLQAKVILGILKRRGWNYIALVTTDDAYGKDGDIVISAMSKHYDICIAIKETLSGHVTNTARMITVLDRITIATPAPPRVVVFFGKHEFAVQFLKLAATRPSAQNLEFIFSDAAQLDEEMFKSTEKVSLGSLVVVPTFQIIPEFRTYWNQLIRNSSETKRQIPGNPRLEELFRKLHSCEGVNNIDDCVISPKSEPTSISLYSYYAVISAYVFAYLVKSLAKCDDRVCVLVNPDKVTLTNFIRLLETETIDLSHIGNVPTVVEKYHRNITFRNRRTPEHNGNYFDVYSFQTCGTGSSCFVKVGAYSDKGLQLDEEKLKMYDKTSQEIAPTPAICPENFVCKTCLSKPEEMRWLYIPGDVVVMAICPIHNPGSEPYSVGAMKEQSSVLLAEAFLYALKIANRKQGLFGRVFPGKKIGLLVVDSAYSASVVQKAVYNVFFGGDETFPDWKEVSKKIFGVVGGLGSSISKDVANVIMKLKLPQISYGSTAETLSDRVSYPYFARTCAPDGKQVRLMIGLINKFKWKYVSLVYIDNNYGQKGAELIIKLAKEHGICIAQVIPITMTTNGHKVASELRTTPHAKLVILFVISSRAQSLMMAFSKTLTIGEFVFLGTESWGNRPTVIEGSMIAEGSITLIQDFPMIRAFDRELSQKNPDNVHGTERKWLLQYWQWFMKCSWSNSFDQRQGTKCNKSASITESPKYFQDPWVPFVIYAFYSLIIGVDNAWKASCHENAKVCLDLKRHPKQVYKSIKTTSFDTMGTGSRVRLYDDNGNGRGGYKIFNVQKTKSGTALRYVEVGYWSDTNLRLNMDEVKFPGLQRGQVIQSDIPNESERQKCYGGNERKEKLPRNKENGVGDSTTVGNDVGANRSFYQQPQFIAPIVVIAVLAVVVISLGIVIFCCYRKREGPRDDYITPTEIMATAGGELWEMPPQTVARRNNIPENPGNNPEMTRYITDAHDSGLTDSGSGGSGVIVANTMERSRYV